MEHFTTPSQQSVLALLQQLHDRTISAEQFCQGYMEIIANTDNSGEDLLSDDYFNALFDLCVRIEDNGKDKAAATDVLYRLSDSL